MGSGASVSDKKYLAEQEAKARQIDRELQLERRKKILKLLLLGPGESGKSTTLKQIRIIHDQGFSEEERKAKKEIIYANLLGGVSDVITYMESNDVNYQIPNSKDYSKVIRKFCDERRTDMELTNDMFDAIERILIDPALQQTLVTNPEIADDSTRYFFQNFDRIREKDYIPTQDDILKSRVPTSGVVQFSFLIKTFTFRVFDVGGQKAQRRKWIHIFDDVHAVLFITSLSEYNQQLAEDNTINRMLDSIDLFDQICNNEWFCNTAMILFLNKIDLFAEKIQLFPITVALKNYKGKQEYRPSLDYITKKFKQANKNSKRSIYIHETCATDTQQIQIVINSVIDVVIQQTMQKVGIQ
ncbi:unnamed protein product [Auanema sp. JU1783]|nr:unnamed protein product [Auanema sp. JU1783]